MFSDGSNASDLLANMENNYLAKNGRLESENELLQQELKAHNEKTDQLTENLRLANRKIDRLLVNLSKQTDSTSISSDEKDSEHSKAPVSTQSIVAEPSVST